MNKLVIIHTRFLFLFYWLGKIMEEIGLKNKIKG